LAKSTIGVAFVIWSLTMTTLESGKYTIVSSPVCPRPYACASTTAPPNLST
jgi:hypothetical protein